MNDLPTYRVWWAMVARCTDPGRDSYEYYGGRGVKVHPPWAKSFDNFVEDMGVRPDMQHTLDRIDPKGDYVPENCRWTTWDVQNNNKTNSRFIEHDGQKLTHTQWSRLLGGGKNLVSDRIIRGWSMHEAVSVRCGQKRKAS